MVDIDRLKKLLGNGVHPAAAASAVGCTPGYVSQLLSDQVFAMEVAQLRVTELTKAKEIDDKLDDIEKQLVDKFETLIPYFVKPKDILDALVKINAMKRKTKLEAGYQGGAQGGTTVQINVPTVIVNSYKINMAGGMVEVDGRSLQPMRSTDLLKTLELRRSNGKEPALLEGKVEQPRRSNELSADSV